MVFPDGLAEELIAEADLVEACREINDILPELREAARQGDEEKVGKLERELFRRFRIQFQLDDEAADELVQFLKEKLGGWSR